MELGLSSDFFGNFSTRGERYYFRAHQARFRLGEIETNIGKHGTRKNSNFFCGWRGPLVGVAGCGGSGLVHGGRAWGCGLDHGGRLWGSGIDHESRV